MAEFECDLLAAHRRERKELLSKIQEMKQSIKGDKKKKKQVTAEVALLEAELSAKHEKELSELSRESNGVEEENSEDTRNSEDKVEPKRISKAEKRRAKKLDKAKEREGAIEQQEVDNLHGVRNIESEKLNKLLSARNLSVHEVPSDGDCLYKAIEHQLSTLSLQDTSVNQLRQKVSDHMLTHKDNFIFFLTDPDTGDMMNEEKYKDYCQDIINKPTWGGQVEIQALSDVCGVAIEVIQAEGPSVVTGEDKSTSKLILSYHRHMYGLGEHYNSVVEKVEKEDDF